MPYYDIPIGIGIIKITIYTHNIIYMNDITKT